MQRDGINSIISCLVWDGLWVSENLTICWQLTIMLDMLYGHAEGWYQFYTQLLGLRWHMSIWQSDNLLTIVDNIGHALWSHRRMVSIYNNLASLWWTHDITSGIFCGPSTVFQCVALWVGLNMITSCLAYSRSWVSKNQIICLQLSRPNFWAVLSTYFHGTTFMLLQ